MIIIISLKKINKYRVKKYTNKKKHTFTIKSFINQLINIRNVDRSNIFGTLIDLIFRNLIIISHIRHRILIINSPKLHLGFCRTNIFLNFRYIILLKRCPSNIYYVKFLWVIFVHISPNFVFLFLNLIYGLPNYILRGYRCIIIIFLLFFLKGISENLKNSPSIQTFVLFI
jgi:hypothetical protein